MLKRVRRIAATESGQMVIVGLCIAFGLVATRFGAPSFWLVYALSAVFCAVAVIAWGIRHIRGRRAGIVSLSWREQLFVRPIVVVITTIQAALIATCFTVPLWPSFRAGAEGLDTRSGVLPLLGLTLLSLSIARAHYEKRYAQGEGRTTD